jgi:hypothetical protein
MKKLLFLFLPMVAMALTFNSCTKDDGGDDNGNGTTKLVKQLTMSDGQTYYFEYDNQQRVSKIDYGYGSAIISYSENTITRLHKEDDYEWKEVYTLNSEGYVQKHEYFEADALPLDVVQFTYSGGNMIKSAGDSDYFGDSTFSWQNGNIVQRVGLGENERPSYTHTFTYNDKEDKMNIVIIDVDYVIEDGLCPFFISKFKGMTSKNLISKKAFGTETKYTYDYIFDTDGYPTEIIITNSNGDQSTIEVYYY